MTSPPGILDMTTDPPEWLAPSLRVVFAVYLLLWAMLSEFSCGAFSSVDWEANWSVSFALLGDNLDEIGGTEGEENGVDGVRTGKEGTGRDSVPTGNFESAGSWIFIAGSVGGVLICIACKDCTESDAKCAGCGAECDESWERDVGSRYIGKAWAKLPSVVDL